MQKYIASLVACSAIASVSAWSQTTAHPNIIMFLVDF